MNAFTKTLQMLLLLQENRGTKPVILEAVRFRLQPSENLPRHHGWLWLEATCLELKPLVLRLPEPDARSPARLLRNELHASMLKSLLNFP